ncbi:lysophospholipid acyltransferase family protein [Aestuariimicrobium ganziense]|uniref:lysophospholipid acyltransferase family protein n=1 Tax=Aestuariimicrobium ganziense TaxID=2773677 RepID=UPI001A9BBF78|nr:lysophospholipid acyltransferase family protein [Aestuariimicrobium ganziense]
MPLAQVNREPTTPVFRALARTVNRLLNGVGMRRLWLDHHNLPTTGQVIVVANHMSYFDALAVGEFVVWSGRWPHHLGKAQLWRVPILGWLARRTEQIPVHRGTTHAADALVAARAALATGRCVVVYPEGTLTRDPDLWPMVGRTGAARLALATGAPIVPVAHWGAQQVIPGAKAGLPRLFGGKVVTVRCGEPIDLSDLHACVGTEDEHRAVQVATVRIMDAITTLLETLRDEPAPPTRWDERAGRRVQPGPATLG